MTDIAHAHDEVRSGVILKLDAVSMRKGSDTEVGCDIDAI